MITSACPRRPGLHLECEKPLSPDDGPKSDRIHLEQQRKLAEVMGCRRSTATCPWSTCWANFTATWNTSSSSTKCSCTRWNRKTPEKKEQGAEDHRGQRPQIQPGHAQFYLAGKNPQPSPDCLIDIFVESAAQRAPLNSEAKRLVKDFAHLVDDPFRPIRTWFSSSSGS
jgi:[protein-PII] uridylyltransferase